MIITLPENNKLEISENITSPLEIAKKISISLSKNAVGAIFNDRLVELTYPIKSDGSLKILTKKDSEAFHILNHSCAHLLAHAVKNIYKDAKLTIGPSIEEGFFYDIDFNGQIIQLDDLASIEKEMLKIANMGLDIKREEVSYEKALEIFKNNEYKIELIKEHSKKGEVLTIYKQGDFFDLCQGGHVENLNVLKNFKLTNISGAYWRGDSKNKQLTRIYGSCFWSKDDLNLYLINLEERKKRDHKKIGKELELFHFSEFGPGFPIWLNNGMIILNELENYWYDIHKKAGYEFIKTPTMLNQELWEISGHWKNYRENMYTSKIDDKLFAVKPMNCPGGILVYKSKLHSYKDFPLRVAELGHVHRHEASGALNGLFRVRAFTQDDAHIYMTISQIKDEISNLLKLFDEIYKTFNLTYKIELSTRPEKKFIGDIKIWDEAEKALEDALISCGKEFKINKGDGAFYGPKIDFHIKDSMNRVWQCGTIQLDMNLPERFELTYISDNGDKKRPVMLHRAILGSLERFFAIITEHYAGKFPLWLSPRQVVIIPVNNTYHEKYALKVLEYLKENNIRCEIDLREEKLGYKIRDAQTKKIPYQIIIGDKEKDEKIITFRKYQSNESTSLKLKDFTKDLLLEIKEKR